MLKHSAITRFISNVHTTLYVSVDIDEERSGRIQFQHIKPKERSKRNRRKQRTRS